jgi:hypothetical protein
MKGQYARVRNRRDNKLGGGIRRQIDAQQNAIGQKGQRQAHQRPSGREEQAFDQQLAHDAGTTGADGQANGEFPLSRRGARQQQVRQVGTGKKKHRPGEREQEP